MSEPLVEAVDGTPAAALRGALPRYIGYRFEGLGPGVHRGLPSGALTFVISLAEPLVLTQTPDGDRSTGAFPTCVGGLHTSPALIAHDGRQEGIQLDVDPLAAGRVFGVPAGALTSVCVTLDDLLGPAARFLPERLAAIDDWDARFALLDEVLAARVAERSRHDPAPEVQQAWRRLRATDGAVSVAELAAEVGWSRRHLSARFGDVIGLTPKAAGRVLRFDKARRLLQRADRPEIADVAARCGYYDQAHLTRDFGELAGTPPARWLAEDEMAAEFPSVQDDEAAVGAH